MNRCGHFIRNGLEQLYWISRIILVKLFGQPVSHFIRLFNPAEKFDELSQLYIYIYI